MSIARHKKFFLCVNLIKTEARDVLHKQKVAFSGDALEVRSQRVYKSKLQEVYSCRLNDFSLHQLHADWSQANASVAFSVVCVWRQTIFSARLLRVPFLSARSVYTRNWISLGSHFHWEWMWIARIRRTFSRQAWIRYKQQAQKGEKHLSKLPSSLARLFLWKLLSGRMSGGENRCWVIAEWKGNKKWWSASVFQLSVKSPSRIEWRNSNQHLFAP